MQKRTHDNFFDKYLLIISYAAARVDWCNLKPKLRKFANSESVKRECMYGEESEGNRDGREKGRKRERGWRDTGVLMAKRCFAELTGHVAVGRLILIAVQPGTHFLL